MHRPRTCPCIFMVSVRVPAGDLPCPVVTASYIVGSIKGTSTESCNWAVESRVVDVIIVGS